MNKKVLLFMFGLCITLFLFDGKHAFAQVYENKGGIISNPVYDAGADEYTAKFDRFKVKKIVHRTYSDSTYSTVGYDGVVNISSPYDVTGRQYWTCRSYFEDIYYDASGNELGSLRFYASDISVKKCDSNIADNAKDAGSPEACVNEICKCIQELNETAKVINKSVNSNGEKITEAVNSNGEKINDTLKKINVDTTGILEQLTTDEDIQVPDAPVPDIPKVPDVKLQADPAVFEDDTIYFKDAGDAQKPGKMPDSPDIAECWDKTADKVCKGNEGKAEDKMDKDDSLKKDDETKKDDALKKDDEMKKDTLKQDDQMDKDTFKRDDQMDKDTFEKEEQMDKDTFKKEEQMDKDTFKSDDKLNQSSELDQTLNYSKTPN